MITLSTEASKQIQRIIKSGEIDSSEFIRVSIKPGGCSGLIYVMNFDNKLAEDDLVSEHKVINIVTDKKSSVYLQEVELEYSGGFQGKGFYFKNEQAQRVCGCGDSFAF